MKRQLTVLIRSKLDRVRSVIQVQLDWHTQDGVPTSCIRLLHQDTLSTIHAISN
jgi:hypothetical protein